MSLFRLAHLSDPHLPPPQMRAGWRDVVSKRTLSRFAWRRKRRHHLPETLAAITADIRAQAPDHIVITGDLTNFSTPEEYEAARAWMQDLAPASDLTVSPGNHDALVGGADPFAAWAEWLGEGEAFPKTRVRGPAAIVNLCSAIPTAPHLAQGRLGAGQIERLAGELRRLRAEGLFRVLLLHHPISKGAISGRKSLTDAGALREVLKAEGAELILHGHAHAARLAHVEGPNGPIPVLGVPSASDGEHARWHSIEVAPGQPIRVTARGLSSGEVEELGSYTLTP